MFRGVANGVSDHFLVETKLSLPRTWDRKRKSVIRYERLKEEAVRKEYERCMKVKFASLRRIVGGATKMIQGEAVV